MSENPLVGTWLLVDFHLTDASGGETRPWGEGTAGHLIYAADGYMSAGIRYVDASGAATGLFYSGPYEALADRNVHHIEISSDPTLIGTDQVRLVSFDGENLVLTASPSIAGGPGSTANISWKRV